MHKAIEDKQWEPFCFCAVSLIPWLKSVIKVELFLWRIVVSVSEMGTVVKYIGVCLLPPSLPVGVGRALVT